MLYLKYKSVDGHGRNRSRKTRMVHVCVLVGASNTGFNVQKLLEDNLDFTQG